MSIMLSEHSVLDKYFFIMCIYYTQRSVMYGYVHMLKLRCDVLVHMYESSIAATPLLEPSCIYIILFMHEQLW